MSRNELIAKIEALNEWEAMMEEAKTEAEAIRSSIKAEMEERGVEELQAGSYIIRWTSVLSNRFDSAAFIPTDLNHNSDFVVRSHPAALDGFVSFYRKAVQALNLFGAEHCVGDRAEQDYTGKVLVLSPDTLKESCWSQENQLWYAHDGFGCSPHAIGRSVRCTCLSDGEMTRWNRNEFIGVLDDKFLPEWAKPKLAELNAQEQTEALGGMNMK